MAVNKDNASTQSDRMDWLTVEEPARSARICPVPVGDLMVLDGVWIGR